MGTAVPLGNGNEPFSRERTGDDPGVAISIAVVRVIKPKHVNSPVGRILPEVTVPLVLPKSIPPGSPTIVHVVEPPEPDSLEQPV